MSVPTPREIARRIWRHATQVIIIGLVVSSIPLGLGGLADNAVVTDLAGFALLVPILGLLRPRLLLQAMRLLNGDILPAVSPQSVRPRVSALLDQLQIELARRSIYIDTISFAATCHEHRVGDFPILRLRLFLRGPRSDLVIDTRYGASRALLGPLERRMVPGAHLRGPRRRALYRGLDAEREPFQVSLDLGGLSLHDHLKRVSEADPASGDVHALGEMIAKIIAQDS